MGGDRVDFFVSHAGADAAWAEWAAWQLIQAGYTVELDVWDWVAGRNFITAMSGALARADRVVALFSHAYFESERYTTQEWSASLAHVSGVPAGQLVPVRVEEVPAELVPPLLRTLAYRDVFGKDEMAARRALLAAVAGAGRPERAPGFPGRPGPPGRLGGAGPRLPGTMPPVWGDVPARNPGFTGRDGLLAAVRERLLGGGAAVVQALAGMGGVGKTQLAAEYAHRFASAYDIVWWIAAEPTGLIGEQVAALATQLGCAAPGAGLAEAWQAVLAELRGRDRWLLVFDNAEDPGDLVPWLPGGAGHVLITSRARRWAEVAVPVEVDVLARAESVALLRDRVAGLAEAGADRVAKAVGDLPLALAQAAAYLAETGMPAGRYAALLGSRAAQLMGEAQPPSYPQPLAAVTVLALDRLRGQDPAAAELAAVCAFLGPEPVPPDWFPAASAVLPAVLAGPAADSVAWAQVLARLSRSALARIDGGLVMHRLTQAIIRTSLPPDQVAVARELAEAVLAASDPGNADVPGTWPVWAQLLPHLLALDPATTRNPDLRQLARDAGRYLIMRGDPRGGHDLASRLYQHWRDRLGPDDLDTLSAGHILAHTLREMGGYREARQLSEDTLARLRRVLGEDHPNSLGSATGLAADLTELGEYKAARELNEDTLARLRRVLGEDHPNTLMSASNLAVDLGRLGEYQAARELDEDTLARCRRVLGEDHPETLTSASNLAADLSRLGEHQAARELNEDTLARRRRVLGEDHPETLTSASNRAADLTELGEYQAARELDEDTLARYRRVLGQDHPETLTTASNLAADLRQLGEHQAARELDEDTLARYRRVLGEDHPDTQRSAGNLAEDLRALGQG